MPVDSAQPNVTLRQLLRPHRAKLVWTFLLTVTTVSLLLWLPFITRWVIDGLEAGTINRRQLMTWGLIYLAGNVLVACFSRLMRLIPITLGFRVANDLREAVFVKLLQLDRAFYLQERTGDIMARMTSDITAIQEMIGNGILNVFRGSTMLLFAFAVMFSIDSAMAWTLAAMVPVMITVVFTLLYRMRPRYQASQEQLSSISSFSQENFSGIRLVKGFGIEQRQQGAFDKLNREYIRRNLSLSRIESAAWPLLGSLFTLSMLLIVWVGGNRIIAGKMSVGTLVQFQQYLLIVTWPFIAIGWTMNLIIKGRISLQRIRHLLDAVPAIAGGKPENQTGAPLDAAKAPGEIEFRRVMVEIDGRQLLDDVSLTIPTGQTLGITGPTGCGKSLLISLLVRQIDPTSGTVLLDGLDLRDFPLRELRTRVGLAPQEPFLFSESLAENIAYGEKVVDMAAVRCVSEIASFLQEAEDFPQGFETELGERGVTLSGGQRQRASIARALIGDPEILILDDTLSAVDTQTEAAILDRLQPILQDRTAIIISHRISSLRDADHIVVMDEGRLVQGGSHEELIRREGYYQDLDTAQRLAKNLEARNSASA